MKPVLPFLVLVFWCSSWFPASVDSWAVLVVVGCLIGLLAAYLARNKIGATRGPTQIARVLVLVILLVGGFFSLKEASAGTTADGAILFFYVLGGVGYVLLLRDILVAQPSFVAYPGHGVIILVCLAVWSWGSALAMYTHRGVDNTTTETCILLPVGLEYIKAVEAIWEMRLPDIAVSVDRPRRSVLLNFHAIVIGMNDGETAYYNWSKRLLRFERLDPERNTFVEKRCPA